MTKTNISDTFSEFYDCIYYLNSDVSKIYKIILFLARAKCFIVIAHALFHEDSVNCF